MRKLKLQMQITVDGFVAGPNGENDWVFIPGTQDPAALQATIEVAAACDTILAGRKLAAGFNTYWQDIAENHPENPWNPFAKLMVDHRKIVFSHTETSVPGRNVEVENGDLATIVTELKNQPGKDILVYGGVEFVRSLISLNLVDEYHMVVNPVAIGSGQTIFKERKILKLESSTVYTNSKMLNVYVPV